MMPAKPLPSAEFDTDLKAFVVPGKPSSIDSLVTFIAKRCKERNISPYRIMRMTGMTQTPVYHFFQGYRGTSKAGLVKNPESVGRVRLDTFLKIVQSLGFDIEIVAREKPGRDEL
ncbi:MAG TPA: hypothetical protein VLM89_13700 [Phycisphaerae bacterium]|nr:hypothetical protein [Phycisphaerae bacterium]